MKTIDLFNWLKPYVDCPDFTRGWIDTSKEKTIALYVQSPSPYRHAIGTISTYQEQQYSLLLRWGKDFDEAEIKVQTIFKALEHHTNFKISNTTIIALELLYAAPLNLGRDDQKIVEFTIEFKLIYNKQGE